MMINEHISPNRWMDFFTHSCTDRETAILIAHVAGCPECRSIYEYGKNLRRRLNAAQASQVTASSSAYQAVASASDTPSDVHVSSVLTVQISRSEAAFCVDTIEATGYAEMYALNPEMNGKILRDDGDLLVMELRDDSVFFTYNDQVPAFAAITHSDWIDLNESSELPLIPGDKLTLEIMFLA